MRRLTQPLMTGPSTVQNRRTPSAILKHSSFVQKQNNVYLEMTCVTMKIIVVMVPMKMWILFVKVTLSKLPMLLKY